MSNAMWLGLGAVIGVASAILTFSQLKQDFKSPTKRCSAKAKSISEKSKPNINTTQTTSSTKSTRATVEIEYCAGCRWMQRAGWAAMELLTTFNAGMVVLKY